MLQECLAGSVDGSMVEQSIEFAEDIRESEIQNEIADCPNHLELLWGTIYGRIIYYSPENR